MGDLVILQTMWRKKLGSFLFLGAKNIVNSYFKIGLKNTKLVSIIKMI